MHTQGTKGGTSIVLGQVSIDKYCTAQVRTVTCENADHMYHTQDNQYTGRLMLSALNHTYVPGRDTSNHGTSGEKVTLFCIVFLKYLCTFCTQSMNRSCLKAEQWSIMVRTAESCCPSSLYKNTASFHSSAFSQDRNTCSQAMQWNNTDSSIVNNKQHHYEQAQLRGVFYFSWPSVHWIGDNAQC